MGRVTKKENFRVVIEPHSRYLFNSDKQTEAEWQRDCEDIASEVRRHVDGVRSVSVEYDVEGYCEHCGWSWTEGADSPHNGGCCKPDCDVMDAQEVQTDAP